MDPFHKKRIREGYSYFSCERLVYLTPLLCLMHSPDALLRVGSVCLPDIDTSLNQ